MRCVCLAANPHGGPTVRVPGNAAAAAAAAIKCGATSAATLLLFLLLLLQATRGTSCILFSRGDGAAWLFDCGGGPLLPTRLHLLPAKKQMIQQQWQQQQQQQDSPADCSRQWPSPLLLRPSPKETQPTHSNNSNRPGGCVYGRRAALGFRV